MRRGFGRQVRRFPSGPPEISPALQHANQLMATGDYPGAATAFEDLARLAEARSGPRAPFLFLQAGRAYLQIGQPAAGVAHLKHGLSILAESKRYGQLYRAGARITQELRTRGLEKEAQEIAALIQAQAPHIAEMATEPLSIVKPILPTHCPACGGPIRSDEVEWIDAVTAECLFCGSPVRAGK